MPIEQYRVLPFVVRCDECGECMGSSDLGGDILHDDEAAARQAVGEWEWRLEGDTVTCESCLEEEKLMEESRA